MITTTHLKRTVKLTLQYGPLRTICFLRTHSRLKAEIASRIKDTIARYKINNPGAAFQKYLDVDYWLFLALQRVFRLGLHRGAPKSILDLGTGAGYFPYACQYFGHDVEALDVPDNEMYNEIIEKLDIKRHTQYIKAFHDLDIDGRFDLVTAFMVCFNNHKRPDLWHCKEWDYFLNSLAAHQLQEKGEVFLSLNSESDDVPVDAGLVEHFRDLGSQIDGLEIRIKKEKIVRLCPERCFEDSEHAVRE